jgi:DNA-3-methyladenine glycosylase
MDPGFDRSVFTRPTLEVARRLIGARLVREAAGHERREGRIVEVEAYIGEEDRASHARPGRTARNAVMYGPPGVAYVYLVYGMHDCLNVVTEPAGRPAAILIRGLEPIVGLAEMRRARLVRELSRRRLDETGRARVVARIARLDDARLAAGPGAVAAAFDIDRRATGTDLCDPDSDLRLEPPSIGDRSPVVRTTPRIGIAFAGSPWTTVPWRFVDVSSALHADPEA